MKTNRVTSLPWAAFDCAGIAEVSLCGPPVSGIPAILLRLVQIAARSACRKLTWSTSYLTRERGELKVGKPMKGQRATGNKKASSARSLPSQNFGFILFSSHSCLRQVVANKILLARAVISNVPASATSLSRIFNVIVASST